MRTLLMIVGCLIILSACKRQVNNDVKSERYSLDSCATNYTNSYGLLGAEFYQYLKSLKSDGSSLGKFNDRVSEMLYKLKLQGELHVRFAKKEGNGDHSWFYFKEDEPKAINSSSKAERLLYKRIRVECTPMGAWQIYLLHNSKTVLPLYWHACYIRRTYVFSKDDLIRIQRDNIRFGDNDVATIMDQYNIYPEIELEGNIAKVKCCYWNQWRGLVRETVTIHFKPDSTCYIDEHVETEVLFACVCSTVY